MKQQNQVVLSLGSNVGNRLEQLTLSIKFIHEQLGTVVRISSVYETPAWGFESEPFYNAVILVHSQISPEKFLKHILTIEKKLGRIRKLSSEYEARIIDIDIIAWNEEVISQENLQVPHPRMQERKFVLQPLLDLNLDWKHPVLNQTDKELFAQTKDESSCLKVANLTAPLEPIVLSNFNYIAIEGNIGAGKTTLCAKLAEDFNAKLVLERFADNPFLPKFYKDQNRYAFPLEMSFLADRYQQLTDDLSQFDLFKDFIIADYHIFKSLIFAKVTLAEDEFRLYKTMFDIIHKEMPKPDLYVYLYQNTDRLLQNIKRRGRSYEQNISAEYLNKINLGYLDYIKTQTHIKTLIIDISERDFVKNQGDYLWVLNQMNISLI
jgi:deoxyguanosine kinase